MKPLPERVYYALREIRKKHYTEAGWEVRIHPDVWADYLLSSPNAFVEPVGRRVFGLPLVEDAELPRNGVVLRCEVQA